MTKEEKILKILKENNGINTEFYKNSRDYVTEEKQNTFMNPNEVAKIICDNVFSNLNLNVSDIIIERN